MRVEVAVNCRRRVASTVLGTFVVVSMLGSVLDAAAGAGTERAPTDSDPAIELAELDEIAISDFVVEAVNADPSEQNIAALVADVAGAPDAVSVGSTQASERRAADGVILEGAGFEASLPSGDGIGLSVAEATPPSEDVVIDGATVVGEALPATDIVTRPIEGG